MVNSPEIEKSFNDIQGFHGSFEEIVKKYLDPVIAIQSLTKLSPPNATDLLQEFKTSNIEKTPQESLTHAFYRYLGFPVIAPDGSYYSPGFQSGEVKKLKKKQEIANKLIGSQLQEILRKREILYQSSIGLFGNQDLRGTLIGIAMKIPRPFQILDLDKKPLETDQQLYTVAERKNEIQNFSDNNQGSILAIQNAQNNLAKFSFGFDVSSNQHLLKPFSLDPRIENTVLPDDRQICVPFLKDKNATALDGQTFLSRSGIEFIIRERLTSSQNSDWLVSAKKILSQTNSTQTDNQTIEELRLSLSSLTIDQKLNNQELLQALDNQDANDVLVFNDLIKTLRYLLQELLYSVQILDQIQREINWFPAIASAGPQEGVNGSFLRRSGSNVKNFPLDQKILELRIKRLDSEHAESNDDEIGSFASPFTNNFSDENVNRFSEVLDEALNKRNELSRQGFEALRKIEIITGEISGLGLIDIVIVYAALWTIPVSSLLGLIDQESYQRIIINFPTLKAAAENNKQDDIFTSLQNLQQYIFNLTVFADQTFKAQKLSPVASSLF